MGIIDITWVCFFVLLLLTWLMGRRHSGYIIIKACTFLWRQCTLRWSFHLPHIIFLFTCFFWRLSYYGNVLTSATYFSTVFVMFLVMYWCSSNDLYLKFFIIRLCLIRCGNWYGIEIASVCKLDPNLLGHYSKLK